MLNRFTKKASLIFLLFIVNISAYADSTDNGLIGDVYVNDDAIAVNLVTGFPNATPQMSALQMQAMD
jgi:hypothetical protein